MCFQVIHWLLGIRWSASCVVRAFTCCKRELQIGGRFTDRVYANNNAACRYIHCGVVGARKGYRRTRIGAVKARTSRLGRSLNDSPDNGDECGHNSPRLSSVQPLALARPVSGPRLPILPSFSPLILYPPFVALQNSSLQNTSSFSSRSKKRRCGDTANRIRKSDRSTRSG